MNTYVVTPDIYLDGWDEGDVRQRVQALFDWLQDCPLVDIAFVIPDGCVMLLEADGSIPADAFMLDEDEPF